MAIRASGLQDMLKRYAEQELAFRKWYLEKISQVQKSTGFKLDPNPDAPEHFYDYRAAYMAGAGPDSTGHWPSKFKREGHPRLFLDGKDTRRDDWGA